MKSYISGVLTLKDKGKIERYKKFYEALGKVCEEFGIKAFVPHLKPKNDIMSARKLYNIDKKEVLTSDIIIAYLGDPSFGVGMELAYADLCNIPIILLYEKGKYVTRFCLGIPNVKCIIRFSDFEECLEILRNVLSFALHGDSFKLRCHSCVHSQECYYECILHGTRGKCYFERRKDA